MPTDIWEAQEVLKMVLKDFSLLKINFHDGPQYELPKSPQELLERLKEISTVFNSDMSFNGKSSNAEKYALCLIKDGKKEEALELFKLITEDEKDLLSLNDPPANGCYVSQETADMPRKLGYEGVFQYAKLLIERNPNRAKKLLLEIVEKVPVCCPPMRLGDVRVSSIELLMDLGVHTVNKMPIARELQSAKSHQC